MLRGLLQPPITQAWLCEEALLRRRARRERRRRRQGRPHLVRFFHQVDDPRSWLCAQALDRLRQTFDVVVAGHTVGPTPPPLAPRPDLYAPFARTDSRRMAPLWGLEPPLPASSGAGDDVAPPKRVVSAAQTAVVAAEEAGDYLEMAIDVGRAVWADGDLSLTHAGARVDPTPRLQTNEALRRRLGHFQGGAVWYEGEWYEGNDRLWHLQRRLVDLRAGPGGALGWHPDEAPSAAGAKLEVFASIRSPYSYLAIDRVRALRAKYGLEIAWRPVLPMVLRGLPVPWMKRRVILTDAAREARHQRMPFGRICDPLPAVRNVYAVFQEAEARGCGPAFWDSAAACAWAYGVDLSSRRGLYRAAAAAGLDAAVVDRAVQQGPDEAALAANRADLERLGLWGVPSFRLGGVVTWGQDRLPFLKAAVQQLAPTAASAG